MSIGKQLTAELKALRDKDGGATQAVTVGPVTVHLFDNDRYSATLQDLEVRAELPAGANVPDYLREHSAAITRGLSFLEEPLAVWELDGGEGQAQLRSCPPQREGNEVSYWEVQLSAAEGASAKLARYRWEPGLPEREPLPYPATFATLGRLADALEAALAEPKVE